MSYEGNVFKRALAGVDAEPELYGALCEREEEKTLMNAMEGNRAVAILGPCGSGKTTLFHRVFSEAKRKEWLLGKYLLV